MKKLLLILFAVTLAVSCSKDDDSSSIVGTWANDYSITFENQPEQTYRDEWKFSSDGMGTYKEFDNGDLDFDTTFLWSQDGDEFFVEYTEVKSNESFTIGKILGKKSLEDSEGYTVAIKE
ncbi:hypothetical protein [Cellulophaga fucicola]|uniref:Lipocalin-like domain-containing protein n=1 Tax=Cellulophaga fucicola TaxID=76595 RepID=A0A1K1QUF1_9FLAO|nr:hypothetical protein [Cellulophaga fucicola]SFW63496.1 hypothetical protein SAMN05660313_02973 [Cellulophaga fucicola]